MAPNPRLLESRPRSKAAQYQKGYRDRKSESDRLKDQRLASLEAENGHLQEETRRLQAELTCLKNENKLLKEVKSPCAAACNHTSTHPRPASLRSADTYTVAIICPMNVELAPVLAMLDEHHPDQILPNQRYKYYFGRMAGHDVVVATMPRTGNNTAAAVITQVRNDFKSLRFCLLVGIGGGIPHVSTHDIRLGDVVVGSPNQRFGGVVQFDMGKVNANSRFERTGQLNDPPDILVTSMKFLIAKSRLYGDQFTRHLREMSKNHPRTALTHAYPGEENDVLYHPLSQNIILYRARRASIDPKIHYGTIGSSNLVIKDGEMREALREELGILCVDMEAAGLVDGGPCLVIRGVSDYADSHKTDLWQPYAAATAAAYAKELLSFIPTQLVRTLHHPGRSADGVAYD